MPRLILGQLSQTWRYREGWKMEKSTSGHPHPVILTYNQLSMENSCPWACLGGPLQGMELLFLLFGSVGKCYPCTPTQKHTRPRSFRGESHERPQMCSLWKSQHAAP